MGMNKIRVVCNPVAKHISYYYKNELNEWRNFSSSSPLSRNYYTETTLENRVDEIVFLLDEIYNRRNKGLEILLEGDEKNYSIFCEAIKKNLSDRKIVVMQGGTRIIVAGKSGSGKSTLIEGIEELNGMPYTCEEHEKFYLYKDDNNTEWYEIKGIDLGEGNMERAYKDICELAKNTSAIIVYCILSINRKMEESEKNLILQLVNEFPELAGMIVLTYCTNKKGLNEFIVEIEKMTNQIKVIPTLAKAFVIENDETNEPYILNPFGLEKLAEYVFEGR